MAVYFRDQATQEPAAVVCVVDRDSFDEVKAKVLDRHPNWTIEQVPMQADAMLCTLDEYLEDVEAFLDDVEQGMDHE